MGIFQAHWPIYSVYPACTAGFWLWYLFSPRFPVLLPTEYKFWQPMDQKTWRQNTASAVHTLVVVTSLIVVLLMDDGLRAANLNPYYNVWLYCSACISLAFFSFAFPWSLYMNFVLKAGKQYTTIKLCVHHGLVLLALLVYVTTQYCARQGALGVLLMDFTNLFFLPHLLLSQLQKQHLVYWTVNGVCFILSYTATRMIGCTWLSIGFAYEASQFEPEDEAGWAAVLLSLACLWLLLFLSRKRDLNLRAQTPAISAAHSDSSSQLACPDSREFGSRW